jgi:hypothetical protein
MQQTPDPRSNPFAALDQLASALALLLEVTSKGQWTQIELLLPTVSAAVDAALKSPLPEQNTAAYRSKLIELLAMHKSAIEQCSARMSDIAPMINSFAGSNNTIARP